MAYFSNLDKRMNNEKKPKMSNAKITAIILTTIASIGYFSLFVNFLGFIKYFILGTFGVFAYVLFTAMYFISGMLLKGKVFNIPKKLAIMLSLALISILAIFHMAFSGGASMLNYGSYLSSIYNMQISVGGVLLGLLIYPLQKLLNVGAYVLFIIMLIVCTALIYNYVADSKLFSKLDFKIFKKKQTIKQETRQEPQKTYQNTVNISNESRKVESVGLNAEIKHEETAREIALKKLGLDKNSKRDVHLDSNANQLDTFKKNYMNAGGSVFAERNYVVPDVTNSNLKGTFGYSSIITEEQKEKQRATDEQKYQEYRKFMGFSNGNNQSSAQNVLQTINTMPSESTESNDEKLFGTPDYTKTQPSSANTYSYNISSETNFLDKLSSSSNPEVKPNGDLPLENATESDISAILDNNLSKEETSLPKSFQNDYSFSKKFDTTQKNPIDHEITKIQNYSKPLDNQKSKIPVYKYTKPTLELLNAVSTDPSLYGGNVEETARKIEDVLKEFKIPAKVINITRGPAVTRYELEMPIGISVNRIPALESDISMRIATTKKIMIEAPIPGMNAVGIEVPNDKVATVSLKDVISSQSFLTNKSPCAFGLGKEINGNIDICAVNKMPHVLIAGSTGSGKSVCLNCLILSILYKSSPEDVKFILIDPKRVEFSIYQGLPHLVIPDIISEPRKADNALAWAIKEMEKRYLMLEQQRVRDIEEYNNLDDVKNRYLPKMPYIIIIMDEFADMMQSDCKDIENKVIKLAAKARAAGIHLVLSTQRPSVDVLSGTAKNNFPARIAFFLTSQTDSRTILGYGGAENLLGKGDMLYVAPGSNEGAKRLQGCFVSNSEVKSVVDYVISHNEPDFDEEIQQEVDKKKEVDSVNPDGSFASYNTDDDEEEMKAYAKIVLKDFIRMGRASASYIQRTQRVGYVKSARIVDYLAKKKYIGDGDGSAKSRPVYITKEQYIEIFGDTDFDNHD